MNSKPLSQRSAWQSFIILALCSTALLIILGYGTKVNAQSDSKIEINTSSVKQSCLSYSKPVRQNKPSLLLGDETRWRRIWDLEIFNLVNFHNSDSQLPGEEIPPECQPFVSNQTNHLFLPIVHGRPVSSTCSENNFGTMLLQNDPNDYIKPIDVLAYANEQYGIKGLASAGAPSEIVRDEWFSRLPGWTRMFLRGTYDELNGIHFTATWFGMEEMYECFGYGPESKKRAGDEALNPNFYVPEANNLATAAGKCLNYGPSVQDYELMATPPGGTAPRDSLLAQKISVIAPYVDIWMVQVAKYQNFVDTERDADGNPYSIQDFQVWISKWVSWIKTSNPNAEVWTQVGLGRFDPAQQQCLTPQPPEYLLQYRDAIIEAGVDGMWVMPSMPCQQATNPQSHENYLQTLVTFKEFIDLACSE